MSDALNAPPPLRILLVDDEPLARQRLLTLLGDIAADLPTVVMGEAADGRQALQRLFDAAGHRQADVVLADIRMPGMDGLELASHLAALPEPPALVFVTAYDNHALQAFDLNAIDYLLKPVRASRLLAALRKVPVARPPAALLSTLGQAVRGGGRQCLSSHERGRISLVPVEEILYLRADLKYVAARTAAREFLVEESLAQLEQEFPGRFLRLHRSVLVARHALAGLERGHGCDAPAAESGQGAEPGEAGEGGEAEAYGWARLRDLPERLPVSRRQWTAVRALLLGETA